jgi:hypothetical protein
MADDEAKRRAKRKDFSCEIKARFEGQPDYTSVVFKNISSLGLRAVISGRLVKAGDFLDLAMCLDGKDIRCKGKVSWVLMLRPGLGNINVLDVGIEFCEINAEDKEFLEKLTGK